MAKKDDTPRINLVRFGADQEIDDYVKVDLQEYKPLGYKTIQGGDGREWRLIRFKRTVDPDIELFEHSLQERDDGLYVRCSTGVVYSCSEGAKTPRKCQTLECH